jgi:hypothetical protein
MEGQTETQATAPTAGQPRPSRDQVLAEMPFGNGPAESNPSSKAAESPPAAAEDVDEKAVGKTDPETDKRLSAVQKAEKHSREKLARERAEMKAEMQLEFDRQRAAIAPHMESLKAYEAAKARAATDPVAMLKALDVPADQWDYIAQQIYNNSKAAESDPKRKEFAAQAKEKREYESRMEAMQKRIDAMENEKKQQLQAAEQQKLEDQYFGELSKAVTDDSPLTKKLLDKNPTKARTALLKTAERLFEQTGELPDAEDVLAAYEKARAEELAELGLDIPVAKKAAPAPAVDEKRAPSKTLDTAPTGAKPAPAKGKPTRDELLRDMPWNHGS